MVDDFGNDEGTFTSEIFILIVLNKFVIHLLGTRTNKSKATAANKLTKYHIQLGKVLGARNAI